MRQAVAAVQPSDLQLAAQSGLCNFFLHQGLLVIGSDAEGVKPLCAAGSCMLNPQPCQYKSFCWEPWAFALSFWETYLRSPTALILHLITIHLERLLSDHRTCSICTAQSNRKRPCHTAQPRCICQHQQHLYCSAD